MRRAFDTARKCVGIFGVVSGIVVAVVAAVAIAHGPVTIFMWVRAGIMLLIAPLLHRLVVRASEGGQQAFERLRTVSVVLPIAIVGVDVLPGVAPVWYAVLQGLSAVALLGVAVLLRRGPIAAQRSERRVGR